MTKLQVEDILYESLAFLGGEPVIYNDVVTYGRINIRIAPKEGKANTLLADHLFSPALFLAERIERRRLAVQGKTTLELGAGSGLPSLLMATIEAAPSLVVLTDYPDANILGNLKGNVERNRVHYQEACKVICQGYEWGTDVEALLKLLPSGAQGYDIMILSDLLHFHASHDSLIASIKLLLRKSISSRVHISAGNYTHPNVCDDFLLKGANAGLLFEEIVLGADEGEWKGKMEVAGLTREALALRKAACRYWIGSWLNQPK